MCKTIRYVENRSFSIIYISEMKLFVKVKCTVKYCAFDFFYLQKQKYCHSPPTSLIQKILN